MPHRTLRTIGATVVLAVVSAAGIAQMVDPGDEAPAEIVADDVSTTEAGDSRPDTSVTSTTEAAPFVYRIGLLSGVTTDNFWAFYGEQPSVWNSYVLGPTKPALYTSSASGGSLQPELATSEAIPTLDENGWRVRVDLDPDLTWSDGEPITARDFVFTFETVRNLDLGGSWADSFPKTIESVHAEGDHQIRIEFTERPRLSVWPHGVGLAPVMARHIWEDEVDGLTAKELYRLSAKADVGGGPLAIDVLSETRITSTANPGYPEAGTPDVVQYQVYPDEAAALSALDRGEIDTILSPQGLTVEHGEELESQPGIEILTSPGNSIRYLGFNLERAPMSEPAFRNALALLVDRAGLAGSVPGAGPPAWALVPESNGTWFDPEVVAETRARYEGPLSARLETALQGLEEAGYRWQRRPSIDGEGHLVAGTGLTIDGQTPQPLTILTPGDAYDPARPVYVAAIAAALDTLGFDARPVETDFDTVVDLTFSRSEEGALQYDMYVLGWSLGDPALPEYHEALFAGTGALNNTGYDSKSFAKALDSYRGALTTEDAYEALWDMEVVLANDLPYLPLYTSVIIEAYRSDRVSFGIEESLGGIQGRLGGVGDVRPVD